MSEKIATGQTPSKVLHIRNLPYETTQVHITRECLSAIYLQCLVAVDATLHMCARSALTRSPFQQ